MSQASRIHACSFTDGLAFPTWNLEISNRSRMMLIANLMELIKSGTLGLSKALVHADTEVSKAELSAEKALIRTYFKLAARTSIGTNESANLPAAARKMMLSSVPRIAWKAMRV